MAEDVGAELHRHEPKPAHAPGVVAAQALVQVKGHAFVFGLFRRMPTPQGFERVFCASKTVARLVDALERQVAKDRGVVLECGGDGQLVQVTLVAFAEKLFAAFFQALLGARTPMVQQTLFFQVRVVEGMQVAVGRFLAHKAFGNFLEFGIFGGVGQLLGPGFDGIDERLLTHRKAHGQGVGISRQKRIAAVPVARETLAQVHAQAAHGQLGRGGGVVVHGGSFFK